MYIITNTLLCFGVLFLKKLLKIYFSTSFYSTTVTIQPLNFVIYYIFDRILRHFHEKTVNNLPILNTRLYDFYKILKSSIFLLFFSDIFIFVCYNKS